MMNPLLKLILMAAVILICSKVGAQVSIDNAMLSGVKIEFDTSRFIFDSGTQTITGYIGLVNGHLIVPQKIGGVQVKLIEWSVFFNKKIKSVSLPEGLIMIDDYQFANETFSQTHVTIPSTVTYVGEYAFYAGFEITKITIGSNVTLGTMSIGSQGDTFKAFYDAGGKLAGTYEYIEGSWVKTH